MTPISFFAAGDPKAQPRPRAFAMKGRNGTSQVRVYDPGTAEGWKSCIASAAKEHVPFPPLLGPLRVDLVFYFGRPQAHYGAKGLRTAAPEWHTGRPDRDNLEKGVLDALTTIGMWKDDAQVCSGTVEKKYCTRDQLPGALIKITPLQVITAPKVQETMERRLL